MRSVHILLVAGLCFLLGSPAFAQDVQEAITVYVFTNPSGGESSRFTDPNSKRSDKEFVGRSDSVRDIKSALAEKKAVRVVDNPEDAQVKIEVTWRSPFSFNIFKQSGRSADLEIKVLLSVDDYSLPISGQPNMHVGWKGAAENVAGKIEDWVIENRDQLNAE